MFTVLQGLQVLRGQISFRISLTFCFQSQCDIESVRILDRFSETRQLPALVCACHRNRVNDSDGVLD